MGKKELKYCTDNEKNILNWANYEWSRQNKNLFSLHDKPNKPNKKGPLSFVLSASNLPQFQQSAGANPL
jgi:hypothetical protein